MASKHKSRSRNEVIRCQNCGEDYSVTYKCCPFCDESAVHSANRRGGKRLNTRGGGYGGGWSPLRVVTTVLSVALIIAAVYIVVTIVKPLVDLGGVAPEFTAAPATDTPAVTEDPAAEPSVEETAGPSAGPSAELQTAESFTLNASDFTLAHAGDTYHIRATFSPSGATGTVTWTSSNPTSVYVAGDGTVTGLASGNSTITAALENGYTQKCIVRCGWSGDSVYPTPGSGTATAAPAEGTGLAINRTDITLSREGETFSLRISGTDSTPAWSSSDSSVASVSSAGKVTAVSHGTITVSAAVEGQTFKCIVRCSF